MYTLLKVRSLSRTAALSVALVVLVFPGLKLACQVMCAAPVSAHHHHEGHPQVVSAHFAAASADQTALRSVPLGCDHSSLSEAALLTPLMKAFAPTASVVPELPAMLLSAGIVAASPTATISPPGARSAPLHLRI